MFVLMPQRAQPRLNFRGSIAVARTKALNYEFSREGSDAGRQATYRSTAYHIYALSLGHAELRAVCETRNLWCLGRDGAGDRDLSWLWGNSVECSWNGSA